MEAIKQAAMEVSMEELQEEQQQIDHAFRSLRFAQKIRQMTLSCYKGCGGTVTFPFRMDPDKLLGKEHHCFGDCMNVNLEKGPFLKELGDVPEGSIPKKFVWAHGLAPTQ